MMKTCASCTKPTYLKLCGGFTLVELLVVVIVIGTLLTALLMAAGNASDSAKKKVCSANCQTILRAYTVYKTSNGSSISLDKFIEDKYEHTLVNDHTMCPSKGTYSAKEDADGRSIVVCSVHNAEESEETNYMPGTTLKVTSSWPKSSASKLNLYQGNIFSYTDPGGNTKYYLVTADLTKFTYKSDPESVGSFSYYAKEIASDNVIDWESSSGKYLKGGSLVKYDGSYYMNTASKYVISGNIPVDAGGNLRSGWVSVTQAAF
ncbi:MAG: prepilin-type N-terminal cleavage/methylation domain-containing protein [Synergistaceae bacterium]|nr:prepilin-type N-terminal cleavage/methylation domain-containing protein [Synergistaceae bacterium]